jgi:hypothetical protein
MLFGMIETVTLHTELPAISIPDILFDRGVEEARWERDPQLAPLFRSNILYYGFRYLPPVLTFDPSILAGRRFVLLLRDPRDALVSGYYSFGRKAASHVRPTTNADAFEQMLDNVVDDGIDAYVLDTAKYLKSKLEVYRSALNYTHGLVLRYEDAYFDKVGMLRQVFAHLGINIADDIVSLAAATHDIRPAAEDETRHIRQGVPGDHVRKLRSTTIDRLNDELRDVAGFFGYKL